MNNLAVAYVRVSTGRQKREGVSPEVQASKIRYYAEHHTPPLEIVEFFEEARSGFQLNARVAFYEMLDYVQQHKVGHVLYYLTNRISRNDEDWAALKRLRVRLHNVLKGTEFTPGNKKEWRLKIEEDRDAVEAERSSAETGDRVYSAQVERAAHGKWMAQPPLGYIINKQRAIDPDATPRYFIDEQRGPLIQQMFRLFATGTYTRRAITTKVKEMGLLSLKGHTLHRSQIESYLKNMFFTGRFKWDGIEYENKGQWEPLISKALFEECQEVFNAKRSIQRRGVDYKYKSLLTCSLCGCAFIRESQTTKLQKDGSKKFYGYYRCTFQRKKCYEEGSPRFTAAEMDALVEAAVGMLHFSEPTYEWLKSQVEESVRLNKETSATEAARLQDDIAQCEEQRGRAWKAYLDGVDPDFVKEEIRRLGDQKAALAARLAALDVKQTDAVSTALDALLVCKSFQNQYISASIEKQRRLNHLLFINVKVKPLVIEKQALFADLERAIALDQFPLEITWNQPFAELHCRAMQDRLDAISRADWKADEHALAMRKSSDFVRMAPRAGLEPAT